MHSASRISHSSRGKINQIFQPISASSDSPPTTPETRRDGSIDPISKTRKWAGNHNFRWRHFRFFRAWVTWKLHDRTKMCRIAFIFTMVYIRRRFPRSGNVESLCHAAISRAFPCGAAAADGSNGVFRRYIGSESNSVFFFSLTFFFLSASSRTPQIVFRSSITVATESHASKTLAPHLLSFSSIFPGDFIFDALGLQSTFLLLFFFNLWWLF